MLTVTTQYRGGGGALLKTPRSTSHTIYIGEAPEAGGSTEKPAVALLGSLNEFDFIIS